MLDRSDVIEDLGVW